jgi:hypothetical protein
MTDINDIYVYLVKLPEGISEMVAPSGTGYTIYIDERLNRESQLMAYRHALCHIEGSDFEKGGSVQEIETNARNQQQTKEGQQS